MRSCHLARFVVIVATICAGAPGAPGQAQSPVLHLPPAAERQAPLRSRHGTGLLIDCNDRVGWREPKSWSVTRTGDQVIAWNAAQTAALVRTRAPQQSLARAHEIARRLAGVELTFDDPSTTKRHRWRSSTSSRGRGPRADVPIEVHIEQIWRGHGRDAVWIAIAVGNDDDRARAMNAIERARTGARNLPSHACECKTDCAPPRTGRRPAD